MAETPDDNIPTAASRRLREGPFTSDLSVGELVCLEDLGVEPLGLVLGSSIYHVGYQLRRNWGNQELGVLSEAMYSARSLAIGRMEAEARVLEADGIVGVRFSIKGHAWGPHLLEFLAMGTAVRSRDRSVGLKPRHGRPFSSDLSGQDFWKLIRAGYRPVQLVMGSCVYHVGRQNLQQVLKTFAQNTEMENYTRATYEARELAMNRMEAEARHSGAEGVVAVDIEESSWGWESHVIEFFALGTAVVRDSETERSLTPRMVLPLSNP